MRVSEVLKKQSSSPLAYLVVYSLAYGSFENCVEVEGKLSIFEWIDNPTTKYFIHTQSQQLAIPFYRAFLNIL